MSLLWKQLLLTIGAAFFLVCFAVRTAYALDYLDEAQHALLCDTGLGAEAVALLQNQMEMQAGINQANSLGTGGESFEERIQFAAIRRVNRLGVGNCGIVNTIAYIDRTPAVTAKIGSFEVRQWLVVVIDFGQRYQASPPNEIVFTIVPASAGVGRGGACGRLHFLLGILVAFLAEISYSSCLWS